MKKYLESLLKENCITKWGIIPADEADYVKKPDDRIKSYIICLIPYHIEDYDGNVAMYAAFPDYHIIIPKILESVIKRLKEQFPDELFTARTDTSALNEVVCAEKLKLGAKGLNRLLLNEDYGSYFFIAEIETSLKLDRIDADEKTDVCIKCGACLKKCPAGALDKAGFTKEKCVSDITQKKGVLNEDERRAVISGEYIWGCDICQKVCPINRKIGNTIHKSFPKAVKIVTKEMVNNPEYFNSSAFAWRGKNTILRNIELKKTNR